MCVCVRGGGGGGVWGGLEQEELVTAAGTAGGLSRLRQVHPPVPPAVGSGRLGLVLGKLLCCNDMETFLNQ